MPTFGGRAIPGIGFSIGNSHQDLKAVTDDLKQLRAVLQSLKDDAKGTTDALNALGKTRPAPRTAPAPKSADDQEYERVVAQRRQATRAETVRRANDPLEQQYAARTATQRQQRMEAALRPPEPPAPPDELTQRYAAYQTAQHRAAMEKALAGPTEQERQYQEIVARDRQKQMEETVKRGTTNPEAGALGRLTNFAGWSPFMPQSMYLAQMALGETGLGLGLPMVAAGMGALGIGAAGLGINAFAVNEARTGAQLVSATGAPPFAPNTFATPADEAKLLLQRTGAQGLNLPGNDGQEAVSALAAGGLTGTQAFGVALDQTAALVNAFGMSVTDAANFVTTMQVEMNRSTQETTATIAAFGKVAEATGQPLAALGQIAQQTPNLLTNLSGPGAAVAASVARSMAGSTPGAIALQSVANASGAQALSIAAQMGMSDQQFNALQSDPTGAGQKRIDDWTVGLIQQSLAQSGGATDQAMIVANARLGANFDKATFTRLANLGPDVSSDAFIKALTAPTPALTPGSAGNVNAQIASGNLAAASSAANPANVKDMAVTAAQVFLTGAISFGESYSHALQSGANLTPAQLAQVRQGGGVAGAVAGGQSILERLADWTTGVGLNIHQHFAGAPSASSSGAPGGGGSTGGAVQHQVAITVDVRQGGVSVGSTPSPINVAIQNGQPSQQYRAYVQTTGRGQQYP